MEVLKGLTPAETLFVIDSEGVNHKKLLKYTFVDLVFKGVLAIRQENKRHKRSKRTSKYMYVIPGNNFGSYTPLMHEVGLLSPYLKNAKIKVLFSHFVQIAYEKTVSTFRFKKNIIKSKAIHSYVNHNLILHLLAKWRLNKKGENLKSEILKIIDPIDEKINEWVKNDQAKLLDSFILLGSNFFILNNVSFNFLNEIDQELIKEKMLKNHVNGLNYFYWGDFGLNSFDQNLSSFDDILDSFDSDFDSAGCSSFDSGCSSCSGCGGCGGCG